MRSRAVAATFDWKLLRHFQSTRPWTGSSACAVGLTQKRAHWPPQATWSG